MVPASLLASTSSLAADCPDDSKLWMADMQGTSGLWGTCMGQQAALGRDGVCLKGLGPDTGELTPDAEIVWSASTPADPPHDDHALRLWPSPRLWQLAVCNVPPAGKWVSVRSTLSKQKLHGVEPC